MQGTYLEYGKYTGPGDTPKYRANIRQVDKLGVTVPHTVYSDSQLKIFQLVNNWNMSDEGIGIRYTIIEMFEINCEPTFTKVPLWLDENL